MLSTAGFSRENSQRPKPSAERRRLVRNTSETMVWSLIPTDPLSGEVSYYIFAKGTYKVGRKGCDVTISKDKGVSRVHAEIIIDAMEHLDPRGEKSANINTKVRIRDFSKYGTFVTRVDDSKEKVHESPSKETALKDGDLISFGTSNAAYRFCFVPFLLYVCQIEGSQGFHSVQDMVLSIGAIVTKKCDECTHVIVDQFTPVNDDFIDAIVSKKPFASHKWLEVLIESRFIHEIPSCSSYAPTLTLDGVSVVVADSRVRENCLKGYTFILEYAHMYKFSSRLPLILEVAGAKTVSLEFLDSNSQDLQGESDRNVHVVPAGSATHSNHRGCKLQANEMELIRAVISGYLDPSILVQPAIVLSSSSTDETIVADSDAETETESANSGQPTCSPKMNRAIKYEDIKEEIHTDHISLSSEDVQSIKITEERKVTIDIKDSDEPVEHESKLEIPKDFLAPRSGSTSFVERNDRTVIKGKIDDGPEDGCSEVLYSQALIMRDINMIKSASLQHDEKVVNFKRFRKVTTESGNSYTNLVPFAKNPYMNSEYEKEVVRSVEEEKKRKKMEAMSEELFNHEKGRRGGAAGSLHKFLARRR
ncbi:hypothetical protein V2J09_008201 [Rumex salicifolius]